MTHTPGPWEADDESIYAKNADGSWQQVAELPGWRTNKGEVMSDTDHANARLIAAAPDMLAALKRMERVFRAASATYGDDAALAEARAVIAKAEGGAA
jgi:hypothetical protein